MESLIEVKNLEVQFEVRGVTLRAVDDVSFTIAPGETLGLVGESGEDFRGGDSVRRHGPAATFRIADEGDPGQPDLHDLPGAHDFAQPSVHCGRPGGGGH